MPRHRTIESREKTDAHKYLDIKVTTQRHYNSHQKLYRGFKDLGK